MAGTTIKEKLQRRALVGRKVANVYRSRQEVYKLLMPSGQHAYQEGKALTESMREKGFRGHIIGIVQKDRKDFDLVKV